MIGVWYRIWSDGWIEQGGSWRGKTTVTVNLLKTYKNTNYTVAFANFGGTCYCKKNSVSQIYMHDAANANSAGYSWYCCGY